MPSSARWLVTSFIVILVLVAVCTALAVVLIWRSTQASSAASGSAGATAPGSSTAAWVAAAPGAPTDANDPAGLPRSARQLQILSKAHFTIGYDPALREPAWVSYSLAGPIRNHGHEKRPDKFLPDPDVAPSPRHEDYSRSGYDRGHMCPAYAEFSRFGPEGMNATFVITNICPQIHGLNAGRWEDLEAMIAGREREPRHHGKRAKAEAEAEAQAEAPDQAEEPERPGLGESAERVMAAGGWAAEYGTVFVTDGPIVGADARRLRAGEAVPSAFFMILLRQEKGGHWRSLAFELPNQAVTEPLEHFLVPIARIERETGLTFVSALPPDQREALTGDAARQLW